MKLLTCSFLLVVVFSQMILLNKGQTIPTIYQSHKSQLQLYQMTNKIIQKQLIFNGEEHWCYIPISNVLIPSPLIETIQSNFTQNKHYLKPLEDLCAIYRTKQFIYKLCYGEEIRQLDDEITKRNMGKPEFENFLLGKLNKSEKIENKSQIEDSDKEFLHIKQRIGRSSFQFRKDFGKVEHLKDFGTFMLKCYNLENRYVELSIMWIGKSQFLVLDEYDKECFSVDIQYKQSHSQKLIQNQSRLNAYLSKFYLISPAISHVLNTNNEGTLSVIQPKYLSEHYIEINDSLVISEKLVFVSNLSPNEILTQRLDIKELLVKLNFQDKILIIYNDGKAEKIKVSEEVPLLFKPEAKLDPKKVKAIFRVENREPKNISLQLSNEPITFFRIEAGDRLQGLSTNTCIQVKLSAGKIVKLIQEDGRQYFLRNDGPSFRSKTNKNNYSKQMQNQNEYYQNNTVNGFLICGEGIWGIYDTVQSPEQFYRLPITGQYEIVSDYPIYVRAFNQKYNNRVNKKPLTVEHYPLQGLQITQNYENGDKCSQNLFRSTKVTYECGNSWFSIIGVSQEKICTYQITVETRLLCPKDSTFNSQEEQNRDTICSNQKLIHLDKYSK